MRHRLGQFAHDPDEPRDTWLGYAALTLAGIALVVLLDIVCG